MLKAYIRNLSPLGEFCLVLLIFFGGPTVWAIEAVASNLMGVAPRQSELFSDAAVAWQVIVEIFCLVAAWWIGSVRGWSVANFGAQISWRLTRAGLAVFGAAVIGETVLSVLLNTLHPGGALASLRSNGLTIWYIAVVSIVNPLFEEFVEIGYIFYALRRCGVWTPLWLSALLTAFLHSYQGLNGVLNILLLRLIFGLAYLRWRQMWPLVVAHGLSDFLGLAWLAYATG